MGRKKILVIDHELFTGKALRLFFEVIGTTFFEAQSSEEGLEILSSLSEKKEGLPDVVMIEVNMPDTDYVELTRKIRDNDDYNGIKLVAIASKVKIGMAAEMKKNGFDAFLPKPFFKDDVIATISTLLGDNRKEGQIVTKHMAKELLCKGLTILVVEDNEVNQKLISRLLKNMGANVELANNGLEAIEKAKNSNYDIILMDIQMPLMGGLEATENIRKDISKDIPIIALTASVMDKARDNAMASGMNAFLTKPINMGKLKETLVKWGKKW